MLNKYIVKKNKKNTILINKYDSNELYLFEGVSKIIIDNINLTKNEVIDIICSRYNVSKNTASFDYDEFIESLQKLDELKEKKVNENDLNEIFSSNFINQCSIEITNICPFKCDHCYVPKIDYTYMNYNMFKKIINQLLELNTRSILITGGDPLVNPEFINMYKYAKENGMFVYINTTLFYLTDDIYEVFKNYKPDGIEISIYGYDDNSYNSFVHVNNSYREVINNINKLKKINLKISLKTVLTKRNFKYIFEIKKLAKKLNLPYRYDYILFPKINEVGCKNSESISPDEVLQVIKQDKEDVDYFKNAVKKIEELKKSYKPSKQVFQCSLGKDRIFIDTYGNVKLCLVVDKMVNIKEKSIREIVELLHNDILNISFNEEDKCYKCYKKKLCRYCPGRFYLETKSYKEPPNFYCELADKLIKEFK